MSIRPEILETVKGNHAPILAPATFPGASQDDFRTGWTPGTKDQKIGEAPGFTRDTLYSGQLKDYYGVRFLAFTSGTTAEYSVDKDSKGVRVAEHYKYTWDEPNTGKAMPVIGGDGIPRTVQVTNIDVVYGAEQSRTIIYTLAGGQGTIVHEVGKDNVILRSTEAPPKPAPGASPPPPGKTDLNVLTHEGQVFKYDAVQSQWDQSRQSLVLTYFNQHDNRQLTVFKNKEGVPVMTVETIGNPGITQDLFNGSSRQVTLQGVQRIITTYDASQFHSTFPPRPQTIQCETGEQTVKWTAAKYLNSAEGRLERFYRGQGEGRTIPAYKDELTGTTNSVGNRQVLSEIVQYDNAGKEIKHVYALANKQMLVTHSGSRGELLGRIVSGKPDMESLDSTGNRI